MNIRQAFEILDINLNETKISNITPEYIKKKYYKQALINHPDKNGNTNSSTENFQKINEAYDYLLREISNIDLDATTDKKNEPKANASTSTFFNNYFSHSSTFESENIYTNLLNVFINEILQFTNNNNNNINYKEKIIKIIKQVVIGYASISLHSLFEELNKETSLEIYNFLFKYKYILHVSNATLDNIATIIKQKYQNDRIFILNPSLNDLLENNIYKLYINDKLYLVPLWHNELYFDNQDANENANANTNTNTNTNTNSEIIVLCNPELPENMSIDEDNNIHIEIKVAATSISELILGGQDITVNLGSNNNQISIPLKQLYMKKEQYYTLKNQGIAQIFENDIYNISCKGDIIMKLVFY